MPGSILGLWDADRQVLILRELIGWTQTVNT